MSEAPDAPLMDDGTMLARVPYGFARRHGLLPTGEADGKLDVAMREGADPKALIELRRFLARPFGVHQVDGQAFDRLLSDLYPSGTEAAAGVRAGTIDARTVRFVTHKDVDDDGIDHALAAFDAIAAGGKG